MEGTHGDETLVDPAAAVAEKETRCLTWVRRDGDGLIRHLLEQHFK